MCMVETIKEQRILLVFEIMLRIFILCEYFIISYYGKITLHCTCLNTYLTHNNRQDNDDKVKKLKTKGAVVLSILVLILIYQKLMNLDYKTLPSRVNITLRYFSLNLNNDNYNSYDNMTFEDMKLEMSKSIKKHDPNKALHILLWQPKKCYECVPFKTLGNSNKAFQLKNCTYQNCFISTNRSLYESYEKFDLLIFHGNDMIRDYLPQTRKSGQLYAYLQLEANGRVPVCRKIYDDYFNLTITYRLDSDIPQTYFVVKDINKTVVAPSINPSWDEFGYQDIPEELKRKMDKKNKLAAWFVSNCDHVNNARTHYIKLLNAKLKSLQNLTIDIYGKCGNLKCPKNESARCNKMLNDKYLFYMAFENSSDEDYVTEKVINALSNNIIPIVYGGANYKRFLPPGSYINAGYIEPEKLAQKMLGIYNNRTKYYQYFRWKSKYVIEDNNIGFVCRLCEILNKENDYRRYKTFRSWWNRYNKCYRRFRWRKNKFEDIFI